MTEDYRSKLGLNTEEYDRGLAEAKSKTEQFQKTADNTNKSLQNLENKSRSVGRILEDVSGSEKAARSMQNYRGQLMKITKQIQDLTVTYRNMDSAMKASSLGQETAAKIRELTERAAEYKDAVMDVQQEITAMASDTAIWDGMKQGVEGVSSVLQSFAAAGILSEESTEKLVKVIAKLKGIEAATNAIIRIGNMLQKNSAAVAAIRTLQLKLQTKATGEATIAQKLLNAAMNANPVGILIGLLATVAAGIAIFASRTKEASEAQEQENKVLEKANEDWENYKKSIGSAVGEVTGKFKSLQHSYSRLSSEMEKKRWIEENKSAFDDLGLAITDVNSADEVFIKQSEAVVAALKARARANALQTLYEEKYKEQAEAALEAQKKLNDAAKVNSGLRITTDAKGNAPDDWQKAGLKQKEDYSYEWGGGQSGMGFMTLTDAGAKKLNEYYRNAAQAAGDELINATATDIAIIEGMWDDAEKEALSAEKAVSKLLKPSGSSESGSNGGNKTKPNEIEIESGSLAEAQKKLNELQAKLNAMSPDNEAFAQTKKELADAQNEVERIKALLEEAKAVEIPEWDEGSLAEAQHFVTFFQKELDNIDPASDEFNETLEILKIWQQRVEEIRKKMGEVADESESVLDAYKRIERQADEINLSYDIGAIDESAAREAISKLNKELESLGLTVRVGLEIDEPEPEQLEKTLSGTVDTINDYFSKTASAFTAPVHAVNNVISAFENMNEKMTDPDASEWEQFFSIFQVGESIIQGVSTVMSVLATVTELLTAMKNKNAIASTAEATATTAETAASSANTTAKITEAAATGALAGAEAGSSVASVPYIGPILAIAAIASVMAAIIGIIASAKGFAEGGIVGGHSYTGDKILARVNSQELILTKQQQDAVWRQMNQVNTIENQSVGGNVTFKVHGTDLVGVLNNYTNKHNKI